MEEKFERLINRENEPLSNFAFYTVFTNNYYIGTKEVRLVQSSFNPQKNKNDFLHFYIHRPFNMMNLSGISFKMKIQRLLGSLLLGICSTLTHNSLDIIIN